MKEERINVHGVGLVVRDEGGDQDATVFLHYGGGNLLMWEPVVPFFRETSRCIRLDLRGHGHSDAPATGYHIETMALDVVGVLDYLNLDSVHVVGSSLGAEVGLALAAISPDRVRSLVCEGAFHSEYGPYGGHDAVDLEADVETSRRLAQRRREPEETYPSVEALVAKTRETLKAQGIWNEHLAAVAAYNAVKLPDGRFVHAWRKWARDEYTELYFGYRFEYYYEALECPVLFLPGEREYNDVIICEAMTGFCRLVDRCEIVLVPGAVHPYGWMLIPREMSQAVLDFHAEIDS